MSGFRRYVRWQIVVPGQQSGGGLGLNSLIFVCQLLLGFDSLPLVCRLLSIDEAQHWFSYLFAMLFTSHQLNTIDCTCPMQELVYMMSSHCRAVTKAWNERPDMSNKDWKIWLTLFRQELVSLWSVCYCLSTYEIGIHKKCPQHTQNGRIHIWYTEISPVFIQGQWTARPPMWCSPNLTGLFSSHLRGQLVGASRSSELRWEAKGLGWDGDIRLVLSLWYGKWTDAVLRSLLE